MTDELHEMMRLRVLRVLQENPDISQRELAHSLGVSLGRVNYCLKALVEKGQVKVRRFRASDQKHRYAYILTPRGISEKAHLTARFLQLKLEEFEALKTEIDTLRKDLEQKSPDA